jgi:hypothetical protein
MTKSEKNAVYADNEAISTIKDRTEKSRGLMYIPDTKS